MKLKESMIREMVKSAKKKYDRTMTIDVFFWHNKTNFRLYVESKADIDYIFVYCDTWAELVIAYDEYMQTEVKEEEKSDE